MKVGLSPRLVTGNTAADNSPRLRLNMRGYCLVLPGSKSKLVAG
jgi:hypothetical protein